MTFAQRIQRLPLKTFSLLLPKASAQFPGQSEPSITFRARSPERTQFKTQYAWGACPRSWSLFPDPHQKPSSSPCSPLGWISTGTWTLPSLGHLLPTYPRLAPFPEDWTAHHLAWSFLALTPPYLTHTHNHHHHCLHHSDCLIWKLSPDSLSPGHKSI